MNEALENLKNANQEANETRIKLTALRASYINLAHSYHQVLIINNLANHTGKNWRECNSESCKSYYEVLTRLGLS